MMLPRPLRHAGFSLLEMAVVLAIVAFVIGTVLTIGMTSVERQQLQSTNQELEVIRDALIAYQKAGGVFPCPAPTDEVFGSVEFGRASACGPLAIPDGTLRYSRVAIGNVPVYDLGLPLGYFSDGWNNRYVYAVDTSHTTVPTFSDTPEITVNDGVSGAITSQAAVVVYSVGPDKVGGYALSNGALSGTACGAAYAAYDRENCDEDNVFTSTLYNDGAKSTHFDDLIVWVTKMQLL